MKYFEFGKENEELMVLLHGGGTSYLGVLPTAKKIAEKYHVVLLAYGASCRHSLRDHGTDPEMRKERKEWSP